MKNTSKYLAAIASILMVSTILMTSATLLTLVNAQDSPPINPNDIIIGPPAPPTGENVTSAFVYIPYVPGGTTTPPPGSYDYPENTIITFIATPNSGYKFDRWVISGAYTPGHGIVPVVFDDLANVDALPEPLAAQTSSDSLVTSQNPLYVRCGAGYTFQYLAVFDPINPTLGPAIVKILDTVGGTTNPQAGTYTYNKAPNLTITATPNSGYEFLYWIITGNYLPGHGLGEQSLDDLVVKTNPLPVTCGLNTTYSYQPVFAPVGSGAAGAQSGVLSTDMLYAIIGVLVIVVIIAIVAVVMSRRSKKTVKQ